jgi:predicted lipid-binding transport protein (Tim44 family)
MTPRRSRRRALLILAAVLLLALIAAPAALAAAGGGSGGFGGGGGGGGEGGRGAGLYVLIQILIRIAILGHGLGALVLIGLIIVAVIVMRASPAARDFATAHRSQGRAARRRTAQREHRVRLAAAEAAEEVDPAFAPDTVKPAAIGLFEAIQAAWDARDRSTLDRLTAPELAREWHRRLDDFERRGWHNRVKLLGEPTVTYVGLDAPRRTATVRVEAKLRDYVEDAQGHHLKRTGRLGEITHVREYWTLKRSPHGWVLASIEQGAEGGHALEHPVIPTPWSDAQALRDEALIEGAVAEATPDGTAVAELVSVDYAGDARAAALDLSLADGRFAPDVLEVAARRAVGAWAAAVDGEDAELRALAHPDAVRALLHPGDPSGRTRLVVRGPRVEAMRIAALDAETNPPAMTLELEITGRRYLQDRDTAAVIAGSQSRATRFTERWTLALDGDQHQPWRIATVHTPALS